MNTQPTLPSHQRSGPHSAPHSGPHAKLAQAGFSYIALLITLALIGVATAATMQMGVLLQQRVAEEELMAIGIEFHRALISYAGTAQPGQARAPRTMEDLLKDPRAPNIRRHLRKIYIDPMTGKDEWGIIPSPDGRGIVACIVLNGGVAGAGIVGRGCVSRSDCLTVGNGCAQCQRHACIARRDTCNRCVGPCNCNTESACGCGRCQEGLVKC